jgi:hypothetical protein
MRIRFLKRIAGGTALAVMTAVLLAVPASPALGHTLVRRGCYRPVHVHRVHRVRTVTCPPLYVLPPPVRTVPRYYGHQGYGCRYDGGYYHHPYYGTHYHGGVGIHVVF